MSSIYSNETPAGSDQWSPNCANLLVAAFDSKLDSLCLAESVEFGEDFEQDFARTLDRLGIAWRYKPRTFAVEWDEDGNFVDSFTPSFFLPARDMYLEIVAPDCRSFIEQNRKARLLRHQYPATRVEVVRSENSFQTFEWLC